MARSQRSPGQVYADDLKESADNINEAIESIEVRGLNALNDGITEAIMGTKSLGDVFKGVANQIIADLIRIAVQQAIVRPIAEALFGGGSSKSSGGGILGLNNIIKTIAAIPGFATGTNNAPRGLAVVGERGPELVRFNGGEQVIPNHAIGNMGVAGTGASVRKERAKPESAVKALQVARPAAMIRVRPYLSARTPAVSAVRA
nr:phage tail tape measure C-terminal domain-containing protein [Novosphingobium sp.]